jgi:type VI secretion system secreted protein VgrG
MNIFDLQTALSAQTSRTRLYDFNFKDAALCEAGTLLVEAFLAVEAVQAIDVRDIILLSNHGELQLDNLLGREASLLISLADGTRTRFTGLVSELAMLGSTGSLVRYRVRLSSFLWPLSQTRNNCVWQDRTVVEIVESVLLRYPDFADWRWTDDVAQFMASVRPRSYCIQYRESDLDFITRLLGSEGLGWSMEEHVESVAGHRMVLFADSTQASAFAEDATSRDGVAGQGIRYHSARAGEVQDTIQALATGVRLGAASVTTLSYDYKAKKTVAASVPTNQQVGGKHAPRLESYDTPGPYAYASADEAQRYARLQMEAMEASRQRWQARSTVRTLRPGTCFTLTQGPLDRQADASPVYNVLRVVSVGINNLPTKATESLAELFGSIPELLEDCMQGHIDSTQSGRHTAPGFGVDELIRQAQTSGFANQCDMMAATLPWRAPITDLDGAMLLPRATAPGSQSAMVVGPDGLSTASGADELYCDKFGRVRIRFHWQGEQDDANASCWVRVAQRSAGGGMGAQFLPRIGQEVLVTFLENNIDRPLIVGALYNGQGEGGQLPTPGGRSKQEADLAVFARASDHLSAAQGNLAGGNSPQWHGASGDSAGQRNSAAQSGMRSKEFGGSGYNQLLFDDTDQQGRTGLKSTHAATELTLGHMLHSADNFRGSFRGLGAELRTDAFGAMRGGAGLLLSTFGGEHNAQARVPAGDNAPAMAHLKQATLLAASFTSAALTHKTVAFASHAGSSEAGSSTIDDHAAPLKALFMASSGMLAQDNLASARVDADGKRTAPNVGKVPHSTDAIIALAAKGGLGVVAGQDVQLAVGETATFMSGQDSQLIAGGQVRAHTGQAIGILAGAVQPGENKIGLQLTAARDAIALRAHSDVIEVQARDQVNVISTNAHIDWAAAKSITLATAGGASITIAGGNITVACPGKLTVHSGKASFLPPDSLHYPLPKLPKAESKPQPLTFDLRLTATPGPHGTPLGDYDWQIVRAGASARDRVIVAGRSDATGKMVMTAAQNLRLSVAVARWPNDLQVLAPGVQRPLDLYDEKADWSTSDQSLHGLAALDFADAPGTHVSTKESARERMRAGSASGELASFNYFKKIQ